MRFLAAVIVVALLAGVGVPAGRTKSGDSDSSPTARFEEVAERMARSINHRDFSAISLDFAKVMLEAFPIEKSKPFFNDLLGRYGRIVRLEAARFVPPNQAIFAARFERGILDVKIVLDDEDKITGLWFLPHKPALPAPERNETSLRLPFEGSWLVAWGGDTKQLNQHHDTPNQRFAFDFLGVDQFGRTHRPNPTSNEDYFAFGREVLAPADGVVTEVIDGVRDNAPESMNPYSALGNAVFIRHGRGEVSVLAHFKRASIKVKPGDKVRKGQVLGLCGNSGNSSEPHVHYHLQNTEIIQDATGIKCFFENVTVGKAGRATQKADYSPAKGDIIRHGEGAPSERP
ncbi:MAG: peptidoglycan DD-metalloendopeptidase family protein [Phycisphaerales bacterium]|nr:MAG: peptidoglycan DD-metalloendopeptidase family protein [Phycisphaerales bacterium]